MSTQVSSSKTSYKKTSYILDFHRKLEKMLMDILRKMTSWKMIILTVDNIEQMILLCGLELIRVGARTHTRGLQLGTAGRLDHLLNLVKTVLKRDLIVGCSDFADTVNMKITAWNDEHTERPDHNRSHLMHFEATFKAGFGQQVHQKRNWNGSDLLGIRQTEKEIKKRLRVIRLNDDLETCFDPPIFNKDKGTFNLEKMDVSKIQELNQPLIPIKTERNTRTLIR